MSRKIRLAAAGTALAVVGLVGVTAPTASANNVDPGGPGCWEPGGATWGCAQFVPDTGGQCYMQVRKPYLSSGRVYTRARAMCHSYPSSLIIYSHLLDQTTGGWVYSVPEYCEAKGETTYYGPDPSYLVCYANTVSLSNPAGTQNFQGRGEGGSDDAGATTAVAAQNSSF